ncbi:aminoglycoside phosphotransferase family protein [Eionea flava]
MSNHLSVVAMPTTLVEWVRETLAKEVEETVCRLPNTPLSLTPLAGDAGFRQYYRANTVPESLLVVAPVDAGRSESGAYFAELSERLRSYGVATPAIYASDPDNNYLLIESFGRTDLLDVLSPETVDRYYEQAQSMLLLLQKTPASAIELPRYEPELLTQEMLLFSQWFVNDMLAYTLSEAEERIIEDVMTHLATSAREQPQVLVHRDYHSRNLMLCDDGRLGVIDFQDAVYGPITYDLVSLLKDCYVRWAPEQVDAWAMLYMQQAADAGLMKAVPQEQFMAWFHWMGLQRHIKVLGIFARLSIRDGKQRYLQDLPLVIRYVLEASHRYPQTQIFAQWFEDTLLPMIEAQSWYTDYRAAGDQ